MSAVFLHKTCTYGTLFLVDGGSMRTPKRDYWAERGFDSREGWLKYRAQEYREKTQKKCNYCNENYHGNRSYCSNKCNILGNIKICSTGCWEWGKGKSPGGYGLSKDYDSRTQKIGNHQKNILVHRLSYRIFKRKIPKGILICHSCDNRICCNPDHLWEGNHKDNARDALGKGRLYIDGLTYRLEKGCQSPAAKLDPYITEIRKRIEKGERIIEIAERYKVTPQSIYSIKSGKTWRGV